MFTADIEDDVVGTNRARGEQRAVDHEVRPGRHQRSVLEAERLTLGPVREHDRVSGRALGDRSPLASDREAGAAPAEEPTRLQLGDQLARSDGWERPEALLVRGEGFGAGRRPDQLHFRARGEAAGTCRQAVCETPLTRQATAATTLPMQTASIPSIHAKRGSVPVPMPWITAIGHIR